MKKLILYISLIILNVNFELYAFNNNFYNKNKEGYFYYKDDLIEEEQEDKKKIIKKDISITVSEYSKTEEMMEMSFEDDKERELRKKREDKFMLNIPFHKLDEMSTEEIKRLLDITRNISTGRPNKEFVKKYAAVQKFWVDKSENFAKSWSVANLENPDELLYNDIGWTSRDRVNLKKKKVKEDKKFFEKIKSRAGYIVIIEDKSDKGLLQETKLLYEKVKSQTGLDYLIYDYYEVSEKLKRQLKIKLETLPENILLYVNNKKKKIYKRVVQGFSASTKIVNNTKFIFENAILEKDKNPEDRIKKGKK
ncbi:MAG: hypothetical protein CL624_13270 [Arcobacter sp.]|nr:hypothetical protein [Arcobacter sp.]|tara:strand:- start:13000 stop:13923 length:924 start_codon:yes stop_codon:yes gene_type:complete